MLEHWASVRERKRVFFAILVCWSIWVFGCLPSAALWFHLLPHFFNGKQFTGLIHSFQWHIQSLQYVCGKTLTELLWSFTLVVFFDCEIDIGAVWRLFLSVFFVFPPVFVCFIWLYPVYMITSVFISLYLFLSVCICFYLFYLFSSVFIWYLVLSVLSILSILSVSVCFICYQDHLTFYFCLLTFDIWHDMILAQLLSNWSVGEQYRFN